jgi:hypothetical protein
MAGGESYFRSGTHVAATTDIHAESSPFGTVVILFGPARARGGEPLAPHTGLEKQWTGITHSWQPELGTPEWNA